MKKIKVEYIQSTYEFYWLFRKDVLHLRVRQPLLHSKYYKIPLYKVLN